MTVCVLGAPRGGTSAVAGVIRSLGIFFGSEIDDASNEDLDFRVHNGNRAIFSSPNLQRERSEFISHSIELVKARNRERSVWGWKDPIAAEYIDDIAGDLRNPHFVLVFRDIAAISQREAIAERASDSGKIASYMLNAQSLYEKCIRFVSKNRHPAISVSYERFLRYPSEGARSIAEFLGYSGRDLAVVADFANSYIKPDRLTASLKAAELSPGEIKASRNESISSPIELTGASGYDETGDIGSNDIKTIADTLYCRAAEDLNSERLLDAQRRISEIFALFSGKYPSLSGGNVKVLSELVFFPTEDGAHLPFPDQVCGAFFMSGLIDIIQSRSISAFKNLMLANLAIENRLSFDPSIEGLEICRSLYWTAKLHLAKSALDVGRVDVVKGARIDFQNGRKWPDGKMKALGGWDRYDDCFRRFELEVHAKVVR